MRTRLACLALAWSGAARLAGAADQWVEVKTANFTVVSNAGEGTAQKTSAEFEQVRAAYAKVWPSAQLAQGKPTVVLALKNAGTLERWAPGYFEVKGGIDVVSGMAYGVDRVYLLLRTDARPASMHVTPNYNLYRAYVGLLLASSFERRLPLWLSTGLTDVLGNTFVQEKEIQVGRPVPWAFERLNAWQFEQLKAHPRLPLRTILDARADSPLLNKEDQRRQFDAQSYVLVHYLMFGDQGAHSAALTRFQQLWLAGRLQDQALTEAFGDLTALERQLSLYAATKILSFARIPAEAKTGSERPSTRLLPPAEVAGLQAVVHVAMDRPVEAQAAIREARTADARSPASYDAEGLLADHDKDKTRATQAYAQAVELGSTSAYSYLRAAQLAWKPELDASARTAIRQRLERAIELNGYFADAHSYLAEVLEQQGEETAALAPAQRAVALQPGESYPRIALARVLNKLGRRDEARKSAELGLQLAEDYAQRSNAERLLLFLNENARLAQERAEREASQKQSSACEGGDAAACARILPDLESACTSNDARACRYLSGLYSPGGGLPQDAAKAEGYRQRACDAGDKRSCVEHAWALARGEGVAKDEPKAVAMLETLCNADFFPACTRLAYVQVAKPTAGARARARALLARACAGGEPEACSMVNRLK